MQDLIEIRIHGRGGQGIVTSGNIIAVAAFHDGLESQAFPMFGSERHGAPVMSFARISDKKINIRSEIYNPDYVIVTDSTLIGKVDVTNGVKKLLLVNTHKKPSELNIKGNFEVKTYNASDIALKILGKPFVNIAMVAAFAKITKLLTLDSILKAVEERFEGKDKKIIENNKKVVKEIWQRI